MLTAEQIVKGNLNLDCPLGLEALAERIHDLDRNELRRVLCELARRGEIRETPRGYLRGGRPGGA
ncbi:MAG TPA: hypothetical protein VN606_02860 [Thermoleophilaceae bacterium]|nr:hypothetical protein [Thermoleophilaceae bacterium]